MGRLITIITTRNWLLVVLCSSVCFAAPAGATTTTPAKKPSTTSSTATTAKSSSHKGKHSKKSKSKSSKSRGQKAIDAERTEQIQEALIREHYMEGKPSGKWDDATQAALRRFQSDQGWQSKTVPDSRALIKLGLGPSPDRLLNPESAMTTAPVASSPKATKPHAPDASPEASASEDSVPQN